ncbi:MAG: hypothetical protein ACYTF6_15200 [Planctomycetota bacterium]
MRSCLEAKLLGNEVPENVRARLGRTPYIANRLAKLGIVRRVMPARSLLEHLDEYAGTLRSLNRSPQHIQTTIQKCRSIIEWIGAGCFEELEPDEIQRVLAERREARPERFGFGSTNNYIRTAGICQPRPDESPN